MEPGQVTHVLYHSACLDGFGAAFAAWKARGDAATYLPVTHGNPPPELPPEACVVVVDFAWPREELVALRSRVRDLLVLDHHCSSQLELADLPFAQFDMDRAGSGLAWDFFHPGRPLPTLLAYVQDRDLWRYRLPESREVHFSLSSYPFDFRTWDELDVAQLQAEGRVLTRYTARMVGHLADRAGVGELGGFPVPVVNCPGDLRSDVGQELLNRNPEAPFVALWSIDGDGNQAWSLRSRGDFDVASLAASLGGGGHKAAAGFRRGPGAWILAPLGHAPGPDGGS